MFELSYYNRQGLADRHLATQDMVVNVLACEGMVTMHQDDTWSVLKTPVTWMFPQGMTITIVRLEV